MTAAFYPQVLPIGRQAFPPGESCPDDKLLTNSAVWPAGPGVAV